MERCKDCSVPLRLPGPDSLVHSCTGSTQPESAMQTFASRDHICLYCGLENSRHAVDDKGSRVCHAFTRFQLGRVSSGGDTRVVRGNQQGCTFCEAPESIHLHANCYGLQAPFCQIDAHFSPDQAGQCTLCLEGRAMHFVDSTGDLLCLGGGFFFTSKFQEGPSGVCQSCFAPEKEHANTQPASPICPGFSAGSDGTCMSCKAPMAHHRLAPPAEKFCVLRCKRQYVTSGVPQVNLHTRCMGCQVWPIQTTVWQCNDCRDFNLCTGCHLEFQKSGHFHGEQGHSFSELVSPCTTCGMAQPAHHMGQFCKIPLATLRPAPIIKKRRCCNCWRWVKRVRLPEWAGFACNRCKAREEQKHYLGKSKPNAKCDQCGALRKDHVFEYCEPVSFAALDKFSLTSAIASVSISNEFEASVSLPEEGDAITLEPPADPMALLLIGTTGVGKSAMCNALLGLAASNPASFVESPAQTSCTMEVYEQTGPFFGTRGNALLTVIDSPGFNDSGGGEMDEQHLVAIRTALATTSVHAVAVVLNAEAPRMDGKVQRVLAVVAEALANGGDPTLNKLAIMVNRYSITEESVNRRAEQLRRSSHGCKFGSNLEDPDVQKQYHVEQLTHTLQGVVPEHCVETIATEQTFFLDAHFESMCKKGTVAYTNSRSSFLQFVGWFSKCEAPLQVQIPEDITFQQIAEKHQRKMDDLAEQREQAEAKLAAETAKQCEELQEKERKHMLAVLELETKLSESEKAILATRLQDARKAVSSKMLATLCKHIYGDQDAFQANVSVADSCLHIVKQSEEPRYAIVLHKEAKVAVVVFRGTKITSLVDLVTDMDFNVAGHNIVLPPDRVGHDTAETHQLDMHNGIAGRLKIRVHGSMCHESILNELNQLVAEHAVLRLIYTGHSLGGGLAIECRALHLEGAISVLQTDTVTFGAPLVIGSETTSRVKELLATNTYNFVYGSDPVPRMLRFKKGGVQPDYLMAYLEKRVVQPAMAYARDKIDSKVAGGKRYGGLMAMAGGGAMFVGAALTGGAMAVAGMGTVVASHLLGGTAKQEGRQLFENSEPARQARARFEGAAKQILEAGAKYEPCGEDCCISVSQEELSKVPVDVATTACLRAHSIDTYVDEIWRFKGSDA